MTLLDAATGTELERRGFALPPPLFTARALLEAPELLLAVHRESVDAGAEILTAATFRATDRALRTTDRALQVGPLPSAAELTHRAVALAREAAGGRARVAGSIAPLEDCWRPDLVPDDASLAREHAEHSRALADAGADLLLVETQGTSREAAAAVRAGVATGLPVWCSFVVDRTLRLPSGEPLAEAAEKAKRAGAAALLVNCSSLSATTRAMPALAASGLPFGGFPNGTAPPTDGEPAPVATTPEALAEAARGWARLGASIFGGCCGTGPAHVAALAGALREATRC